MCFYVFTLSNALKHTHTYIIYAASAECPFKSALLSLTFPNNMIDEIWKIAIDFTAPDIEVRSTSILIQTDAYA